MYEDNMENVQAPDELVPEGIYHVRVSHINEEMSKQDKRMLVIDFKIQTEGPSFGRNVRVWASLSPNALFTLKGIYKACGYAPGPGGHDPMNILDCELYLKVEHEIYEGQTRVRVPPYTFKPLTAHVGA